MRTEVRHRALVPRARLGNTRASVKRAKGGHRARGCCSRLRASRPAAARPPPASRLRPRAARARGAATAVEPKPTHGSSTSAPGPWPRARSARAARAASASASPTRSRAVGASRQLPDVVEPLAAAQVVAAAVGVLVAAPSSSTCAYLASIAAVTGPRSVEDGAASARRRGSCRACARTRRGSAAAEPVVPDDLVAEALLAEELVEHDARVRARQSRCRNSEPVGREHALALGEHSSQPRDVAAVPAAGRRSGARRRRRRCA